MAFLLTICAIYQYKDHLGNTRINFAKNSAGALEIIDTNNYYPFGLNHIGNSFLSGLGSYNAYKYNGKEIQETGMFDFGARMYMPDLGRWGVVDAYAEAMRRHSPYNYAFNNTVNFIDPDGNAPYNPRDVYGEHSAFNGDFDPNTSLSSYNGMGGSHGMYFESNPGAGYVWGANTKGDREDPKNQKTGPNFWQRMGGFFRNLFGSDKGAGITSFLVGAEVSRVVQVGEAISITAESFYTSAGILATRSVWGLPLMLNGDSGFTANSKPITGVIDTPISAEISKGDNNRNGILLYRGVSSYAHTEIQSIMYNEALFGIAIPNGLRPGETAHWNMNDHAMGDNYSVFTSWTSNPNEARNFATNYGTAPGVILSKRFKIGVNAIPNISTNGKLMQEGEWLIFGPVIRANVQHIKP